MKLVFIINNKNNRLRKVLPGLMDYFLQHYPSQVTFQYTEKNKHAVELARNVVEDRCDYLIAVGGDGTLHEVVNGMMKCDLHRDKFPVLGLLPMGSANDFARTTGITPSWEKLDHWIREQSIRHFDVGKITRGQGKEGAYFINISGIGLGAEVVERMERSRPLLGPSLHYFYHILQGFIRYRKKRVMCQGSYWKWEGKLLQMAVANGRYFGNAICVAPDASPSDGQFEIVIFGDLSFWDYVKNLGKLKRGERIDHREVTYYTADKIKLASPEPCGIEADGEFMGLLPATIEIFPRTLRFLSE